MKTKVVGYIRVSSREQRDDGVSLDAQRARIRAYAEAMELELVAIEEDPGISAKTVAARPGLLRALALLDTGHAEGIVVTKLDRLTRSVRDLGDLVERYFGAKFSLLSLSDAIDTRSASGRLVLNVLMSVAQWEREATGERTRDALAHLKAEGVIVGGEPLGMRRTGAVDQHGRQVFEEDPAEAATVRRIRELRGEGRSLRAIVAALQSEGHRTKRGGAWAPTTVQKVLARAA
jgi:site-specific DNA recombinase